MNKVYTLLSDGYADWEIAYVLAELRRQAGIEVATVGFSKDIVTSMGGLRVIPDVLISDIDPQDTLMFILCGGDIWHSDYPREQLEPLLQRLFEAKKPIAAICAATTALARCQLLDNCQHTSNGLPYLSNVVPDYAGSEHYIDSLAVRDRDQHIITASGLGAIEFTTEIFAELDALPKETIAMWYDAFKHGHYPN